MSLPILIGLLVACGVLMLLERSGVKTTYHLSFKGDLKRESAFLAQWGQSVATPLVGFKRGRRLFTREIATLRVLGYRDQRVLDGE